MVSCRAKPGLALALTFGCAYLLSSGTALSAPSKTELAKLVTQRFIDAIITGDIEEAAALCARPINFDGEEALGGNVRDTLQAMHRRARTQRIVVKRVIVLSAKEAVKRFGKPPARIAQSITRHSLIAFARLNRLGLVVVLEPRSGFYRVVALSD
ncbi:MAG: hypothetical protein H6707_09685 [Deltaproteobacteria bacterium]|nr:hypothetical protein [Deltaproteobacteria bacterium]